jgi:hypothetical protein
MKLSGIPVFIMLIFLVQLASAQNAPISTIPDTTACQGTMITIPVRVSSFKNIGSLSLRINYTTGVLSYSSWSNTSGCPGLNLNASIPGVLTLGGFNSVPGGVTFPDNTVLFTVDFLYNGGTASITWNDTGASCEFTGPTPFYQALNDIPASDYYHNGSVARALSADFSANIILPEVGDTVHFTDLSSGDILEWEWIVSPDSYLFVNGTTSLSRNPDIVFTGNGAYSVSLTVLNNNCTETNYKENYIHAGTPGLWTGLVSPDWNFPKNWHNWVVPDQFTAVVIPSDAPYFPEYPGDFTIGIQCLQLTIQNGNGKFTVDGNFQIP